MVCHLIRLFRSNNVENRLRLIRLFRVHRQKHEKTFPYSLSLNSSSSFSYFA